MTSLPYFDFLLERFSNQELIRSAFQDHVHWGLFDNKIEGKVTVKDYLQASQNLSESLIGLLDISSSDKIIDVGCGFGGTSRLISKKFCEAKITALNIDERQINFAKKFETPENLEFVVGDACKMPFEDSSFSKLIAVESVFHFPSRLKFLKEAKRVLKPGSKIVLSDFVLHGPKLLNVAFNTLVGGNPMTEFYGRVNATTIAGYQLLAMMAGLKIVDIIDVTNKTLPTYAFFKQIAEELGESYTLPDKANRFMEKMTVNGQLKYMFIVLES